jgi:sortase A
MERIRQIVNRALGRSSRDVRSRQKKWNSWKWLQVSLLVIGFALVGFYGAARLEGYLSSRAALKAFESADSAVVPRALPSKESRDSDGKADDARNGEEPQALIRKPSLHGRTPLGVLEIPGIHLLAPLLEGTDASTLNRGVGRIVGTARPGEAGNIGIAGHRDSFFRGLKDIKTCHAVVLKTATGIDTYVVDRSEIVSPRDVSVLRTQAAPALTLVTCYPFYFVGKAPKRFVVTAYLRNHIPAGSTTSSPRPFTQPTNPTMEEQ